MKTSGSIKAICMALVICLLGTIYGSVVFALENKQEYLNINNEVLQENNLITTNENTFTPAPAELKVEVNVERLKAIKEEEKQALEEQQRKEEEARKQMIVYDGLTLDELSAKLDKSLNSTLSGQGTTFATYATELGIDPYLSVAIVLHETGCKWNCSTLLKQCNNVGGMKGSPGCNGGSYKAFPSLEEGIRAYMDNLYRNYFSVGLTTPETIGPKYAASSTWAEKVNAYINEIKAA